MTFNNKIFVSSTSFSSNEILRQELVDLFPHATFNLNKHLTAEEFSLSLEGCEGAIVGLDQVDQKLLQVHPQLSIVSKFGVGIDNIDTEACAAKNVIVGWTPGTNKVDVAEHTLGLIIGIARNIFEKNHELKKGIWKKNGGRSLSEITVGIIGLGNIGKSLARMLDFFGCNILVHDLCYDEEFCEELGLVKKTKEEILKEADIVSLHIPLTPETYHYISKKEFSLMKNSSWLINTSRGKNVERNALKSALESKLIGGAALDVFEEEPCEDIDLLSFSNLIATPHIAGNSKRAILSMGRSSISHLKKHFEQKVNK